MMRSTLCNHCATHAERVKCRSDNQQSLPPARSPAMAHGAALDPAALDMRASAAQPASPVEGGRATEAAQAAAAVLLQSRADAAPSVSLLPAAAAPDSASGPSDAAQGLGGSQDPDAAPSSTGAMDEDMGDAPSAAAGSEPVVVTLQSSLVVEELRIGRYS